MSSKKKKKNKNKKKGRSPMPTGLSSPRTPENVSDDAIDPHTLALLDCCSWGGRGRKEGSELLSKQIEEVTRLLHAGADANGVDETGTCALWRVACDTRGDRIGLIEVLIAAGADIDKVRDQGGATVLMSVAATNHSPAGGLIIGALLTNGADWRKTDKNGNTAVRGFLSLGLRPHHACR